MSRHAVGSRASSSVPPAEFTGTLQNTAVISYQGKIMSRQASKRKTSRYFRLDARRIARLHGFAPGRDFAHQLVNEYGTPDTQLVICTYEDHIQVQQNGWMRWPILTEKTDLNSNGGYRTWFLCPSCGRRCAIVYVRSTEAPGCRVCMALAYES